VELNSYEARILINTLRENNMCRLFFIHLLKIQLASCNNMQVIMLKSTQNKGFSLTFENGLTISVQFGTGNYCERRDYSSPYKSEMLNGQDIIESQNAEIAIWDKDNNWFDFGSDTVKGWVSANEIAEWIEKISKAESDFISKQIGLKVNTMVL